MRYDKLIEHYKAEPETAATALAESFDKKELKADDFDLGKLFAECFGYGEYQRCKEGRQSANDVFDRSGPRKVERVQEAQGAVSTAAFLNISGQIVYSAFLERYRSAAFIFTAIIPTIKATLLDGEKVAGLSDIGDALQVRNEGDPYALAGPGENWIFTPAIRDRGLIVPVTWEAVFQDRTGRLLDYCRNLGWSAGLSKEKRAIDAVIDENTTAHRYNWRNAGQIATYGDNSGSHTWDNLAGTNALVDHTDIDTAEQVFNGLVDPFTGEPIAIEPVHIVAVNALSVTLARILNSTNIMTHIGGYPVTGNPTTTTQSNPWMNKYTPVVSRWLAGRLATDTDWFLGDIAAAVKYMEVEPVSQVEAPSNNQDEFHRRIVHQFRVNERGQHVVFEPRAMVKSTAA